MRKITKKEINERLKEIKENYFSSDEKIIYKNDKSDVDGILLQIKTVNHFGILKDYTFFNRRDCNDKISVIRFLYMCDIKNGLELCYD